MKDTGFPIILCLRIEARKKGKISVNLSDIFPNLFDTILCCSPADRQAAVLLPNFAPSATEHDGL